MQIRRVRNIHAMNMIMLLFRNLYLLLPLIYTAMFSVQAYADEGSGSGAGNVSVYYLVRDGKVDTRTFMGWRVFHMNYHSCHGIDASALMWRRVSSND